MKLLGDNEEYNFFVTNWKTKGFLGNKSCQSQITKDREEDEEEGSTAPKCLVI